MATYYFRNTGDTNWGTASNWSLTDGGGATGAVPNSADDAYFTSNSGNCTVNTSARVCKTLVFSGVGAGNYSGTITMTFGITVSGNVTLSATMTIVGTGTLTINATSTFTSNTKTWPNALTIGGSSFTTTLADNLSVSGLLTIGTTSINGTSITVNGTFSINSSGGITMQGNLIQGTGTTTLNLTGGTWSTTGNNIIRIDTNINGNITLSGNVWFDTRTLTYLSGTVTTTGSVLRMFAATTLNTSGMTWNSITLDAITITLLSDLNFSGTLGSVGGTTINGNFNINSNGIVNLGSFTISQGTGTTTFNFLSGSWTGGTIRLNTVINGNLTISGTVGYNTGTLTYTSGTVTVTGSTLSLSGTTTLNTSGMTWNNITMNAATVTLTSQLNISGTFSVITTSSTVNGGTINCTGSATSSTLNGTGTLLMSGTGTLTGIYGSINLTINTVGTITITGTLNKGGGTFTYTAGTVSVGISTLLITGSTTLNISGVTWNNVTINDQTTVTLSANLNVGGILTLGSSSNFCAINGAFNINANGNVTVGGTAPITGTSTLVFAGTGTWSNSSTAPLRLNTTINTAGTLTISGNVYYNTGTLTYTTALAISHINNSTLTIAASTTLNTSGMSWNNIIINGTNTTTLLSNLNVNGLLTISAATTINGTFNINVNGGITLSANVSKGTGSPVVNLLGGTWSGGAFAIDVNINGNITVSGSVSFGTVTSTPTLTYISGTVTVAGSTLNVVANTGQAVTLNTGGMTWNNVSYGAATAVLALLSDLNIGGVFTTTANQLSVNGTFNINCSGGINIGLTLVQGIGTTTLYLLGGTWSSGTIRINTIINGNITISGSVGYNTGTLTYTSGTVTTTGSTLNAAGTTILNTNGITWNNINLGNPASNLTLLSDLTINGLLNLDVLGTTVNGSFNINCFGGVFTQVGFVQGTGSTTLNIKGGTWSGTGTIAINTNIDGNITINGTGFSTRTLTYISGNIICLGTHSLGGTINASQIAWNNVAVGVITLLADLNINGNVTGFNSSFTGAFNVNIGNGINITNQIAGNAIINLLGGTLNQSNNATNITLNINGNVTIASYGQSGGTLTFLGGNITIISNNQSGGTAIYLGGTVKGTYTITNNCTLTNFDKVNLRTVTITAGRTITMNKFFSGNALIPTRISSTGTNYTIAFQDTTEKITKFTRISNCTLSRQGQLLCITDKSNKGGNVGIRYINQSPNSIPKDSPSITDPMTYGLAPGIADPLFVTS